MGLEGIILSEIRQILYIIIYMWNLKNKMNENNKSETDSHRTNYWLSVGRLDKMNYCILSFVSSPAQLHSINK